MICRFLQTFDRLNQMVTRQVLRLNVTCNKMFVGGLVYILFLVLVYLSLFFFYIYYTSMVGLSSYLVLNKTYFLLLKKRRLKKTRSTYYNTQQVFLLTMMLNLGLDLQTHPVMSITIIHNIRKKRTRLGD